MYFAIFCQWNRAHILNLIKEQTTRNFRISYLILVKRGMSIQRGEVKQADLLQA